ncbi:PREDICTED: uncharacterized protein LOC105558982 isoform X2 [Vollenhovia emeryi]|uniref:uncharacterized protein LOC105558982 isoform X2 n=1 Tax=Vollenhovia emeryi TaxID=411798 RepID=UPI0005F36557|nr:PREDICTED: uncharacterized protein LOC105558982 isoform X2 [Vollenhovia emeryi]
MIDLKRIVGKRTVSDTDQHQRFCVVPAENCRGSGKWLSRRGTGSRRGTVRGVESPLKTPSETFVLPGNLPISHTRACTLFALCLVCSGNHRGARTRGKRYARES